MFGLRLTVSIFANVGVFAGIIAAISLPGSAEATPNILLIIGDDMGVETLSSYGVGESPPTTAALDAVSYTHLTLPTNREV